MEYIGYKEISAIIKILLYFFLVGFSLFIPLWTILKEKKLALKFSIPISFSYQIILGYLFYCLGIIHLFPFFYFLSLIIINIVFGVKNRLSINNLNPKIGKKKLLIFFILLIPVLFNSFYDSFTHIAPGNNDLYNHITFLKELENCGFLNLKYYAPGFHILLYPLTIISSYAEIYRFVGPVLGIIILLSILLLFKDNLKKNISKVLLIALFVFPVYNQLALQTISFFPSSLSFIYFSLFVYLLSNPKILSKKSASVIYFIGIMTIAITVPYLLVSLIPAIFAILIVLIFSKKFAGNYKKQVLLFFIITCIGFFISLGHVFLQKKIIHGTESGFPKIKIVEKNGDNLTLTSNTENKVDDIATRIISKNTFSEKYLLPIYNLSYDVFSTKNIRSPKSLLGFGSYIWIGLSLLILFFSLYKGYKLLLVISIFSIIYGLATNTGILEMVLYRGRSGWYLLLISILGSTVLFDKLSSTFKVNKRLIYVFISILFMFSFLIPPVFYRSYFDDVFKIATEIKKLYGDKKINFITDQEKLSLLSQNFSTFELSAIEKAINKRNKYDKQFLILNKKYFYPNPVLSQQGYAIDNDFKVFKGKQIEKKEEQKTINKEILWG